MKNNHKFLLPPTKLGAHIGFFGGSFDPPHLGHMMLSLSFLALEPIDELWIVPCTDHAFKKSLTTFANRLAMCELAFSRLNNIRVLDIENHLAPPNFTINTIQAIKQTRPDLKLSIGLGSDLISSFSSWHEATKLVTLASFVIFAREHYSCDDLPDLLKEARVHKGYVLPDTNSTALREHLRVKPIDMIGPFIDHKVKSYIQAHKLY